MSVKKRYRADPGLGELKAIVTKKEGNTIWLDQTIFYAFSGGQESDTGTMNGIHVISATMQKDHDIAYELETTDGIDVGSEVEMKIDQEKRTKLRKLHSLVHIADYVFEEVCGKHESVGSRISPHKGRIDYKYPENINSKLPEIQEKIEKVIQEGHEIKRYVDDEESDRWMWEMNGFKMPCGGTHVRNSSEIGKIKLKRANIGKGKERIECMLVE